MWSVTYLYNLGYNRFGSGKRASPRKEKTNCKCIKRPWSWETYRRPTPFASNERFLGWKQKEVENELHRDVREAEQPAHETNLWTRGVSKCIITNKKNNKSLTLITNLSQFLSQCLLYYILNTMWQQLKLPNFFQIQKKFSQIQKNFRWNCPPPYPQFWLMVSKIIFFGASC